MLIDKCREIVKNYRKNDPVYNCEVHLEVGCSNVDGMLCDMQNCDIRQNYIPKETFE